MWLAAGYFDESLDAEIEDRCFSMAGFYGSQFGAVQLDLLWADTLKRWNLRYFKASEIEFGFGEFAQHRDDPKNLRAALSQREKSLIREIKTAFVDLICQVCKSGELIGIGASCVMRDLYLFHSQESELAKRLPNVYTLCADLMLVSAGQSMTLTNEEDCPHDPGMMQPVFDIQDEYGPRFKASFPQFAKNNPKCSKFLKAPTFEPEESYRCIQAADLLAFEARKLLINRLYDPERTERIAMTRLKQHVDRLYLLDYDSLKMIASRQKADTIPIPPAIDNKHAQKVLK